MPTKEEMLLEIVKNKKYETMRDYCGPCRGAGHTHLLSQRGDRLIPESLPCGLCNGIGFMPKNSVYQLSIAFNFNYNPNKIFVIATTKNKTTEYSSFINSSLLDKETVSGSDEFEVLIRRIYNFEKQQVDQILNVLRDE